MVIFKDGYLRGTCPCRSGLEYQESPNWDAGSWGPEGITRLGQGGWLTLSTKSWRYAWREYKKPKGRAVDRYGLEWSCPGEPYGFDLRGAGAACPNPKYNKPEGRAVDRYGLEVSCSGEPYPFDLRGPGAAYARTPRTKSHATSSCAASTTRSSAQSKARGSFLAFRLDCPRGLSRNPSVERSNPGERSFSSP